MKRAESPAGLLAAGARDHALTGLHARHPELEALEREFLADARLVLLEEAELFPPEPWEPVPERLGAGLEVSRGGRHSNLT